MAIRCFCHASGMTPSQWDGNEIRIATAPAGPRNDVVDKTIDVFKHFSP